MTHAFIQFAFEFLLILLLLKVRMLIITLLLMGKWSFLFGLLRSLFIFFLRFLLHAHDLFSDLLSYSIVFIFASLFLQFFVFFNFAHFSLELHPQNKLLPLFFWVWIVIGLQLLLILITCRDYLHLAVELGFHYSFEFKFRV